MRKLFLALGAFLLGACFLCAQSVVSARSLAQLQLLSGESLKSGAANDIGVRVELNKGWHAYAQGQVGALELEWLELPKGVSVLSVRWPQSQKYTAATGNFRGYKGEFVVRVSLQVAEVGEGDFPLRLKISGAVCSDTQCVPFETELSKSLTFGKEGTPLDWSSWRGQSTSSLGVDWQILLLAILGGVLLNLMPCVFPVLGIKVLSFARHSGGEKSKTVAHSVAYALGIVCSLWALGGLLWLLQAGGAQIGWGFQLQNPVVVWGLILVMAAVATNLSGLWEWPGVSVEGKPSAGLAGSFASGVLMVAVASPCAGPFLAVVLGALAGASALATFAVMTALGVGLAFPYVVLAASPSLLSKLSKPGQWMETLKNFLAFPMWGAVIYLLWVLGGQVDPSVWLNSALALLTAVVGLWLAKNSHGEKLVLLAAFALAAMAALVGLPLPEGWAWEKWSPQLQEQYIKDGRIVLVDFTARWCATCQTNEAAVDDDVALAELLKKEEVALLKADWTNPDPVIASELTKYNRASVPTWVVLKEGRQILLPQLISPQSISKAIEEISLP